MEKTSVNLNGITYHWQSRPVGVVRIDGGVPEYMDHGFNTGIIPNMARFRDEGFYAVARGSKPSFTCPNKMSIVTGMEPEIHGNSGNFYLDRAADEPVVMSGPELLRARSVMPDISRHGGKVASITPKDKLCKQLQKDIDLTGGPVSCSVKSADQASMEGNGIENVLDYVGQPHPVMYSAELSLVVLDAGVALTAAYAEHAAKGSLRSHEICDFALNGVN